VRLSPLDTSATVGLLYQPRIIDDDDYGAFGGMRIGRGNRSTRRKPAPVPWGIQLVGVEESSEKSVLSWSQQ
jgi:hypothetical protein